MDELDWDKSIAGKGFELSLLLSEIVRYFHRDGKGFAFSDRLLVLATGIGMGVGK